METFTEVALRARLTQGFRPEWRETTNRALREAAELLDDAQGRVLATQEARRKVDSDGDLSAQGRQKKAKTFAASQLADLDQAAARTRGSFKGAIRRRSEELAAETELPSDRYAVALDGEIRGWLRSLSVEERRGLIGRLRSGEASAEDLRLAQAALRGPGVLSGYDERDAGRLRDALARARNPEAREALAAMEDAQAVVEGNLARARRMIAEAAGLRLARDGETLLTDGEEDRTERPKDEAA